MNIKVSPEQFVEMLIKAINNLANGITNDFSIEGTKNLYNNMVKTFFDDETAKKTTTFAICSYLYEQLLNSLVNNNKLSGITPNTQALLEEMNHISFMCLLLREKMENFQFGNFSRYKELTDLNKACRDEGSFAVDFYNNFINEVGIFQFRVYNFALELALQTEQIFKPSAEKLDVFSRTIIKNCATCVALFSTEDNLKCVKVNNTSTEQLSPIISHALKTSGISATGTLPNDSAYKDAILVLKPGDKEAAQCYLDSNFKDFIGIPSIYDEAKVVTPESSEMEQQR